MIRKLFLNALLLLSLAGCAHTTMNKLPLSSHNQQLLLPERSSPHGFSSFYASKDNKVGLFAGIYVALREDAAGTYYFGPGKAWWQKMGGYDPYLVHGGVYIPKNPAEHPRPFTLFIPDGVSTPAGMEQIRQINENQQTARPVNTGSAIAGNAIGGAIGGAIVGALVVNMADGGEIMLQKFDDPGIAALIKTQLAAGQQSPQSSKPAIDTSK